MSMIEDKNDSIVQIGDEVLRKTAEAFSMDELATNEAKNLAKEMGDILSLKDDGVALAAPQIGISKRLFIISPKAYVFENKVEGELVFINPEITKTSKKTGKIEEGCLSVIGKFGMIERSLQVTVRAYNTDGVQFEQGCSGLIAQIIQHEIDHLNGIIFVDNAENIKEANSE